MVGESDRGCFKLTPIQFHHQQLYYTLDNLESTRALYSPLVAGNKSNDNGIGEIDLIPLFGLSYSLSSFLSTTLRAFCGYSEDD